MGNMYVMFISFFSCFTWELTFYFSTGSEDCYQIPLIGLETPVVLVKNLPLAYTCEFIGLNSKL